MKFTVLTTITNPEERQDKWREALACYCEFADEVVVVNGGENIPHKIKAFNGMMIYLESISPKGESYVKKVKEIMLPWPHEWNWVELPRHLNAGLEKCTGDWIIKLDIDQFFHEKDFEVIKSRLRRCPKEYDVATFQKMSMTYGRKYYQKGGQPIAFRNKKYIKIGKNVDKKTDLCFAVKFNGEYEQIKDYKLPLGNNLVGWKTGISYWNYDYFFKTKRFTKEEFWRFSKAYKRYYGEWTFGRNKEEAFRVFCNMMRGRHERSPYIYKLPDHSKYIRKAVEMVKPEEFGYNGWGIL